MKTNKQTDQHEVTYTPPQHEPPLVGTKRIAEILGCSKHTVTRIYMKEGMPYGFKGAKDSGKPRYQFNPVACLRWLEKNRSVTNG